jgi:hypothetical protein
MKIAPLVRFWGTIRARSAEALRLIGHNSPTWTRSI